MSCLSKSTLTFVNRGKTGVGSSSGASFSILHTWPLRDDFVEFRGTLYSYVVCLWRTTDSMNRSHFQLSQLSLAYLRYSHMAWWVIRFLFDAYSLSLGFVIVNWRTTCHGMGLDCCRYDALSILLRISSISCLKACFTMLVGLSMAGESLVIFLTSPSI